LLAHDKYAISARIFRTGSHKEVGNLSVIRLRSISLIS
jgi:hypothetical protein